MVTLEDQTILGACIITQISQGNRSTNSSDQSGSNNSTTLNLSAWLMQPCVSHVNLRELKSLLAVVLEGPSS